MLVELTHSFGVCKGPLAVGQLISKRCNAFTQRCRLLVARRDENCVGGTGENQALSNKFAERVLGGAILSII